MLHMSSELFAAWKAYYILFPFGPDRDDYRAGVTSELWRRRHSQSDYQLAQMMGIAAQVNIVDEIKQRGS